MTKAQRLASLERSRDNILAALESYTADMRPDYDLDAQQFWWNTYFQGLMEQLKMIDDRIARLGGIRIQWLGKLRPNQEVIV